MASRWTARRRSQTRIEENHTDRHHEKVGYLATYSSGRNRRARYSIREHTMGRCSFLNFVRTQGQLNKDNSETSKLITSLLRLMDRSPCTLTRLSPAHDAEPFCCTRTNGSRFHLWLSINVGRMRILWDGVDRWLSLGRSRPSFTRHSSLAFEDDQFSPKKAALYKTLSRRPVDPWKTERL